MLNVTVVSAGLRGDLTKWLDEISPGVFVGRPSARVRDLLWKRTIELAKDGRAILVYSADNDQGFEYRVHRHDWTPEDFDGLTLMRRPAAPSKARRRTGWSTARVYRRALQPSWTHAPDGGE